jgi:hypothetical protein
LERWLALIRILAIGSWANVADFLFKPMNPNPTQHDSHGPDDPFRTITIIIIWTYQDMMEWMSRMLVGEKASADADFGSENGQMWLIFCSSPQTLIQLSMIHMDQMILSEPSIIIVWTYQDMMEWMSWMLGEKACADVDFG